MGLKTLKPVKLVSRCRVYHNLASKTRWGQVTTYSVLVGDVREQAELRKINLQGAFQALVGAYAVDWHRCARPLRLLTFERLLTTVKLKLPGELHLWAPARVGGNHGQPSLTH